MGRLNQYKKGSSHANHFKFLCRTAHQFCQFFFTNPKIQICITICMTSENILASLYKAICTLLVNYLKQVVIRGCLSFVETLQWKVLQQLYNVYFVIEGKLFYVKQLIQRNINIYFVIIHNYTLHTYLTFQVGTLCNTATDYSSHFHFQFQEDCYIYLCIYLDTSV